MNSNDIYKRYKRLPHSLVAIVSGAVLLISTTTSTLASESHGGHCTDFIARVVEENNLDVSGKRLQKANKLCMNSKEKKAKKYLLKSPRKPTNALRSHLGRCLDVAGGVNKNTTNVQIFDCNITHSQKWKISTKREIRNRMGRCLDVAGGVNANGTNVQIYDCNGSASQKWKLNSRKEIRNDMGRCLDVAGGVNKNGTNVQIFECNGTKSQKWKK